MCWCRHLNLKHEGRNIQWNGIGHPMSITEPSWQRAGEIKMARILTTKSNVIEFDHIKQLGFNVAYVKGNKLLHIFWTNGSVEPCKVMSNGMLHIFMWLQLNSIEHACPVDSANHSNGANVLNEHVPCKRATMKSGLKLLTMRSSLSSVLSSHFMSLLHLTLQYPDMTGIYIPIPSLITLYTSTSQALSPNHQVISVLSPHKCLTCPFYWNSENSFWTTDGLNFSSSNHNVLELFHLQPLLSRLGKGFSMHSLRKTCSVPDDTLRSLHNRILQCPAHSLNIYCCAGLIDLSWCQKISKSRSVSHNILYRFSPGHKVQG